MSPSAATRLRAWQQRLHGALMPDYNARAARFWWAIVVAGGTVLAASLGALSGQGLPSMLQVAAGALLAMSAGLFPLRVPGTRNSFSASDVPVYLLLLTHGPAAAAVVAAADTGLASWRTSRRWTSRIFTPCASALSMFATGTLLQALLARLPAGAATLIAATVVVALLQFVIGLQLFSGVLRLKRGEPLLQWREAFTSYRWVGLAYAGSAAVAALLYEAWQSSGTGVLLVMVPLLAMLVLALHFYFRQQESDEAMRETAARAAEREAELAAQAAAAAERHLRELEASERRFEAAFTHASIGMALLAFDGRILQANEALAALLGREARTLDGTAVQQLVDEADRADIAARLGLEPPREFESFAQECRLRRADGRVVRALLHCSFFTEPGSESPCLILQAQDVTAQRQAEAGLQHLAFHDPLTGLPNRRRFIECLSGVLARNRTGPELPFAVMFLDCDRFKSVNDTLGHGAGDELLMQLARRIQENVRPHDIVARLGGDEFAILADGIAQEGPAVALAERLLDALRTPLAVQGVELVAGASIGITFSRFGYDDAEALLRDADAAMYKAKAAGRSRYALFDAGMHASASERLRLEAELRRALDEATLSLYYQPQFELDGGRLLGFEALVRWPNARAGLLGPGRILPLAESSHLMERLTDFVLQGACRQLRAWQDEDATLAALGVSVNVAASDLAGGRFVDRIASTLADSGIEPDRLTIELTESTLAAVQPDPARRTLAALRALGVHVAVDDFGTGRSSLGELAQLPVDSLKIDCSFVARLAPGSDESTVVAAIVQLGRTLRKGVVAEGIESDAQGQLVRELGCLIGQGHGLGSPLSADATGQWLRSRRLALR